MFFAIFVFTERAFAQKKEATVNLGTVKVTDEKASPGWRVPLGVQDVSVIGQGPIEESRVSRTVDGLFEHSAGIDLRRTSLTGNNGSEVSLRGFDESRYTVLLDGRPVKGTGVYGGEYVDWSSLSTDDVESVEIIRGATSAEYGDTLGGAINIITKKGSEKMKINLRSSYGSYNTVDAAFSHSGNLGKFIYDNLSYGYWRTDGYLRNNYVNRNNFSGRLNLRLPGGFSIEGGARYTLQKRGFVVENKKENANYDSRYPESDDDAGAGPNIQWFGKPGPFGPVDPAKYWGDRSYWVNKRAQYDAGAENSFGRLNIKAKAYLTRQDRTEYYYDINNEGKLILKRHSEPDKSGGWLAKAYLTAERHDIVYGLDGVYLGYGGQDVTNYDSTYFRVQPSAYDDPKRASRRHGVFAQGAWNVADFLTVEAGLRYDHYWAKQDDAVWESGLSPKFGLKYKIREGLSLEANFGEAYRFPTSPETYWFFAGYNPPGRKSLSPENALQGEVGLYTEFGKSGNFNIRGYYYDVDNYIRTIFGYRPSRVVYNIDKVKLWGVEAEAEYAPVEHLHLFANYTYQDTKKDGDILDMSSELTDRLTELPKNKVNAGMRCVFGDFKTDFVMRYVDNRSVITGDQAASGASELVRLKRFATFDLNIFYKILKKDNITGDINFTIENIFDASYEETEGFPMPGRSITGGANLRF